MGSGNQTHVVMLAQMSLQPWSTLSVDVQEFPHLDGHERSGMMDSQALWLDMWEETATSISCPG